ncbi:hypothetical protein I6A84_43850 [Frankia sp. CNm7]|uniref:CdaR GGDEF-like domain-containing protein n=1 Tax=Frankia nepalensis TaxID=1836974 RepID=A0A937RCC8_9ACTN|nr:hypothetical protein [Frankia nepalensis]MBL7494816.1 hypothetical protein [Frankia nepalensis]MBL7508965.1 hypothetical protein [Frankia nepalensis]MBL7524795.1 hypothetical protein [Frankia nepalensis]MBL7626299.1 hypothetical protein [Frankia nepalensis]
MTRLLRRRGSIDTERTRRAGVLLALLDGKLDRQTAAAALSLSDSDPVVLATARPTSDDARESDAARVVDLVALHDEYWHPGAAAALEAGEVHLLLPVATHGHVEERLADRLRKLGADLVTAARRSTRVALTVGFGPAVPGLAQAARSRHLAVQVLDVLRGDPDRHGPVATLGDVRAEVVLAALLEGEPFDDEDPRLTQVRAILAHDAAQGSEYAQTLLTYLGTFGDIVATAQQPRSRQRRPQPSPSRR